MLGRDAANHIQLALLFLCHQVVTIDITEADNMARRLKNGSENRFTDLKPPSGNDKIEAIRRPKWVYYHNSMPFRYELIFLQSGTCL